MAFFSLHHSLHLIWWQTPAVWPGTLLPLLSHHRMVIATSCLFSWCPSGTPSLFLSVQIPVKLHIPLPKKPFPARVSFNFHWTPCNSQHVKPSSFFPHCSRHKPCGTAEVLPNLKLLRCSWSISISLNTHMFNEHNWSYKWRPLRRDRFLFGETAVSLPQWYTALQVSWRNTDGLGSQRTGRERASQPPPRPQSPHTCQRAFKMHFKCPSFHLGRKQALLYCFSHFIKDRGHPREGKGRFQERACEGLGVGGNSLISSV